MSMWSQVNERRWFVHSFGRRHLNQSPLRYVTFLTCAERRAQIFGYFMASNIILLQCHVGPKADSRNCQPQIPLPVLTTGTDGRNYHCFPQLRFESHNIPHVLQGLTVASLRGI